jgi:hypothetical protein
MRFRKRAAMATAFCAIARRRIISRAFASGIGQRLRLLERFYSA